MVQKKPFSIPLKITLGIFRCKAYIKRRGLDHLYVLSNLQFMRYDSSLHVKSVCVWSHSSMGHSFCFFLSLIVTYAFI